MTSLLNCSWKSIPQILLILGSTHLSEFRLVHEPLILGRNQRILLQHDCYWNTPNFNKFQVFSPSKAHWVGFTHVAKQLTFKVSRARASICCCERKKRKEKRRRKGGTIVAVD